MTITQSKINLREPGFLFWLGKFLGDWNLKGEYQVRRRDDGFLETLYFGKGKAKPLKSVLRDGKRVKRAMNPLGPYPAVISDPLMRLWLPKEEYSRLQNAWHVGRGRTQIVDAIEKSIKEFPKSERDKRWLWWWEGKDPSLKALSRRDNTTHRVLYRQYYDSNLIK